jgi:prepilin-type N-terminal cleavage/methylation domain-containing protein
MFSPMSHTRVHATCGFSFVELLVTLFIVGIMLMAMAGFFSMNVAMRHNMGMVTEAQQGLRALLEIITQELRQAGACLPTTGLFVALDGADGGDQDSLTLRIGQVDQDTLVCVQGGATAAVAQGTVTFPVSAGQGSLFDDTTLVYVTDGANGEFHPLAAATDTTLTLAEGVERNYPAGSGIYGVEERIYAIDTSGARPMMTVAVDGGAAWPLVEGVERFNVQYLLGPCEPDCADVVDLPADTTEWRLVREVFIETEVIAPHAQRDGQYASESGQITVKPRNLID